MLQFVTRLLKRKPQPQPLPVGTSDPRFLVVFGTGEAISGIKITKIQDALVRPNSSEVVALYDRVEDVRYVRIGSSLCKVSTLLFSKHVGETRL